MPLKRSLWPAQHQRFKLHYLHLHSAWRPFKILPAAKIKKTCVQVFGCITAQRCMRFRAEPAEKIPSNKTWNDCAYTRHHFWIAAPPHREAVLPEFQSQGLSTFLFSWTSLKGYCLLDTSCNKLPRMPWRVSVKRMHKFVCGSIPAAGAQLCK